MEKSGIGILMRQNQEPMTITVNGEEWVRKKDFEVTVKHLRRFADVEKMKKYAKEIENVINP